MERECLLNLKNSDVESKGHFLVFGVVSLEKSKNCIQVSQLK